MVHKDTKVGLEAVLSPVREFPVYAETEGSFQMPLLAKRFW